MFKGENFINGEFTNIGIGTFDAINPSTEECYGKFPNTQPETINQTIDFARAAFKSWMKESRVRRSDYFDNLAQLLKRDHYRLRDAISIETGKNLNEAHAEVIEALHMCQYVASMGRQPYGQVVGSELSTKDAYVIRKPKGIVAVISPWNFACAIGSFWSSAPAIVEGCTVVHKPSELTPMVNQIIAELYQEAGFPPGVFNLIHGNGNVGSALVRGNIDVILFTGSAEVGQDIRRHCADTFSKTCSMECGSKSATMVFEDGNHNLALEASIASAFKLSGQRCVSSSRILIQRSIFRKFCEDFVDRVSNKVVVADPFEFENHKDEYPDVLSFGPLISTEHYDRVASFNKLVREDKDVEILYDPDGVDYTLRQQSGKGYFMAPFVYSSEWSDKPFLKQEVFGPHVALIPFDDIDDAIRIYNDTEYGLALGIITDDFRKHRRLAQECTTGMFYVNGGSIAAESHLDFSSWKKSGYGASAAATYKAVTHTMAVTINYEEGKMQFAQGMK